MEEASKECACRFAGDAGPLAVHFRSAVVRIGQDQRHKMPPDIAFQGKKAAIVTKEGQGPFSDPARCLPVLRSPDASADAVDIDEPAERESETQLRFKDAAD
jgi:hypothetical protein